MLEGIMHGIFFPKVRKLNSALKNGNTTAFLTNVARTHPGEAGILMFRARPHYFDPSYRMKAKFLF